MDDAHQWQTSYDVKDAKETRDALKAMWGDGGRSVVFRQLAPLSIDVL